MNWNNNVDPTFQTGSNMFRSHLVLQPPPPPPPLLTNMSTLPPLTELPRSRFPPGMYPQVPKSTYVPDLSYPPPLPPKLRCQYVLDESSTHDSSLNVDLTVEEKEPSPQVPKEPGTNISIPSKLDSAVAPDTSNNVESEKLPKELSSMFQALKCELCKVDSTSSIQAKMHYQGKLHEKRVAQYMQTWAQKTGEPLPKRFKFGAPKKKGAESLRCNVCNIDLTSQQHADQHYMGKAHKRALCRRVVPASNKWQKCPPEDPTGRFNIGKDFLTSSNSDPLGLKEPAASSISSVKVFSCDLCHVSATSNEQLEMHYKGSKHHKALKLAGLPLPTLDNPSSVSKQDSILASVVHPADSSQKKNPVANEVAAPQKDYSIYRTPSGHFYCQPCNLTLNSEAQFGQHCDSKRHKTQTAIFKANESKRK